MSNVPTIPGNNLIDLTMEPSSPDMMLLQPIFSPNESMIVTRRLSDNNPFDRLERIADQFDDPFEIAQTQEAARERAANSVSRNVLTESLIVIEDSPQMISVTSDKDLSCNAETVQVFHKGKFCTIRSGTINSISTEPLTDISILSDDDLMATNMQLIDSDSDTRNNQEGNDAIFITPAPKKRSQSPEKSLIQSTDRKTLIEKFEKYKQKMSASKMHVEKSPSAFEELVESAEVSTIKPEGDSQLSALLERVKEVIGLSESGEIKAKAIVLLDSLNNLLQQKHLHAVPAAPIVRLATFNIENITNQQDEVLFGSVTPASEPSDVARAQQAKSEQRQKTNTTETPMRSTSSTPRSSFSHSNDQDSSQLVRRFISVAPIKKRIPVRKSLQPTAQFPLKPSSAVRHTPNMLKLRVKEMTCNVTGGPMRANIPIDKFAPHLRKPSLSTPTETGSIMTTSTPLNHHNIPQSIASPLITPIKRNSEQSNNGRVRFGNLSAIPNLKSTTSSVLGTHGRPSSGSNSISTASESNKPSVLKKPVSLLQPPRSFGITKKKENEIPKAN